MSLLPRSGDCLTGVLLQAPADLRRVEEHHQTPSVSPLLGRLPFNSSLRCRDVPSRYISILLSEFKLLLSSALIFILPLIEKINSNWVKCLSLDPADEKTARNEQLQWCQLSWWERQGPICHLSSQLWLYYFFCLRQLENVFTAQTVYIQIYEEKRMTPNLGKCQKIKRLSPHHCWTEQKLGREIFPFYIFYFQHYDGDM